MTTYPSPGDYHQAIQNPRVAFSDPLLQRCRPLTDPMGIPVVNSGGFALTYFLIDTSNKTWVVRCFKKNLPDRRERYIAIDRFLTANRSFIFTSAEYLDSGILVNGRRFPIVRMPRVQGQPLHKYIEERITKGQSIDHLSANFAQMVNTLSRLGIAHGDLQHGNIIVSNGTLVLIDYDGMFLPDLAHRGSPERGHRSFQHPQRTSQYNQHLDRFSSIVIYLALCALESNPSLWNKYSNGDNLLFREQDFALPLQSSLLRDISRLPGLDQPVTNFRAICSGSFDAVPTLSDFESGRLVLLPPEEPRPPEPEPPYVSSAPVMSGTDRHRLLEFEGDQVTVVGRIIEVSIQQKYGRRFAFLNFGDWREGCFQLVVWSDVYTMFEQQGKSLADYEGRWVSITGLMASYDTGKRPRHPQMVVELPSAIEVISEQEARRRLRPSPTPNPPVPGPPPPRPPIPAPPVPKLFVGTHIVDFGNVLPSQRVVRRVVIANAGGAPLHVQIDVPNRSVTVAPRRMICRPAEHRTLEIALEPYLAAEVAASLDTPYGSDIKLVRQLGVKSDGGDELITLRASVVVPSTPPKPVPNKPVPNKPALNKRSARIGKALAAIILALLAIVLVLSSCRTAALMSQWIGMRAQPICFTCIHSLSYGMPEPTSLVAVPGLKDIRTR